MIDELIARLEAAAGLHRELLLEAFDALHPYPGSEHYLKVSIDEIDWTWDRLRFLAMLDAEAYESAALTLVPDGMRRRTIVYENGRAGVQLWWPTEPLPDVWGKAYASEPIATVIAALRAKGAPQ